MKEFTLDYYRKLLEALEVHFSGNFYRFDKLLNSDSLPTRACFIRHDVDRKPENALKMAKIEHEMNIPATYYFRTRQKIASPNIIKEISELGHEIGYHYECLSDCNGDQQEALEDFEKNLAFLRSLVPIKTCSMHGSPLKPFDNRDMWRSQDRQNYLKNNLKILGEIYLNIDYKQVAYITDTGRNWSNRSNTRDRVESEVQLSFQSSQELLDYFTESPNPLICFQVHPERWTNDPLDWSAQWIKDHLINVAKLAYNSIKTAKSHAH